MQYSVVDGSTSNRLKRYLIPEAINHMENITYNMFLIDFNMVCFYKDKEMSPVYCQTAS